MNQETVKEATKLLDEYVDRVETYTLEDDSIALTAHWKHGGQKVFVGMIEVLKWIEEHPSGSWKGERIKRKPITIEDAAVVSRVAGKVFGPPIIEFLLWFFVISLVVGLSMGIIVMTMESTEDTAIWGSYVSGAIGLIMFLVYQKFKKTKGKLKGFRWSVYRTAIWVHVSCFLINTVILTSATVPQEPQKEKKYGLTRAVSVEKEAASEGPFADLREKAENGDVNAQTELGMMYQTGQSGVAYDYNKAYKFLHMAAMQNHPLAESLIGTIYAEGQGVPVNNEKAFAWFTRAAEHGLAQAQLITGLWYLGYPGITKDYNKTIKWVTLSADQGYAPAQFLLGRLYDGGEAVAEDDNEAFRWLLMAAQQGWPMAQYDVALMCSEKQDYIEAHKWLLLAQKNGENVSEAIQVMKNILNPSQIAEAKNRTETFVERKSQVPFTSDTLKGFLMGYQQFH